MLRTASHSLYWFAVCTVMVCCNKYKCHSVEMSEQLIKNVSLPCPCSTACMSAQLQDCGEVRMKLWLKIQHRKNINSAYKQNLYWPALSFCFVLLCNRQDFSCASEHTSHCRREKSFLTSQESWGGTRSQRTCHRQSSAYLPSLREAGSATGANISLDSTIFLI